MLYAMPVIIGFILDVMFGDPKGIPSPEHLLEMLAAKLRDRYTAEGQTPDKGKGRLCVFLVMGAALLGSAAAVALLYVLFPPIGAVLEGILFWWCLSAKQSFDDTMRVHNYLRDGFISDAGVQISMLADRDTGDLDEDGIVRTTVETVAENSAKDGTAPLFWGMIGGVPLALMYRGAQAARNILGHAETGEDFRTPSKGAYRFMISLPAAIAARLAVIAAGIVKLDGKSAGAMLSRDGKKYPPSSAIHAAFSGALGVQLGGDYSEGGETVHRETVGDEKTEIHFEDIKDADKLMYAVTGVMFVIAALIRAVVCSLL